MRQEITITQIRKWLLTYAVRIIENEEHLTELDIAIGDADHGANMRRGMEKLQARLQEDTQTEDINTLLRAVAMALISAIGGAAGPLYGTFFLRAAASPTNGRSLDLPQLTQMFRDGLDGLQQRGKAEVDDKTMVDTIQPAVEAMEAAVAAHQSAAVVLAAARQAARLGMKTHNRTGSQKGPGQLSGPVLHRTSGPGRNQCLFLV